MHLVVTSTPWRLELIFFHGLEIQFVSEILCRLSNTSVVEQYSGIRYGLILIFSESIPVKLIPGFEIRIILEETRV